MTNIVLATDGSPYADAAARFITEGRLLQSGFTVHVVHVTPEVTGQVRAFVNKETIDAWHQEESGKATKPVADILAAAGVAFECHALHGFAPERIVAYAASVDARGIVMGTHGRGAFFNAVIGSVAGRVLAHAPCPVILVKAPEKK
ncbi:universal stress protein [Cupriavidus sp. 2TAF22]|uniref:universal stress protein n=1 Tax=unclassified Cupriavidus TaxID=2640874 RepID=UPI003F8FA549